MKTRLHLFVMLVAVWCITIGATMGWLTDRPPYGQLVVAVPASAFAAFYWRKLPWR